MKLKRTPLFEKHGELGAKMFPFAGYEMPIQYSSIREETLAVRKKAGLFDVSHMGEFFVEGVDAEKFVDFLLCNDFLGAASHKAVYSPLCNEKGTVIDDLIAYKLKPHLVLLCVNAANIQKDWDWINSHREGFSVEISNRSSLYSLMALQGPESARILCQLGLMQSHDDLAPYSVRSLTYNHLELIIARTGYTGEDGFEIFGQSSLLIPLWDKILAAGALPCGLASRDVLRIEAGYPLYGHELTEEWTPLDVNLGWTVKSNERPFLGKRALTDYCPSFKLIKLSLEKGIPREGHEVKNVQGEVLGRILSGTLSVTLGKGIGLALVERQKFSPSVAQSEGLIVTIRNKDYRACFHKRPFIRKA